MGQSYDSRYQFTPPIQPCGIWTATTPALARFAAKLELQLNNLCRYSRLDYLIRLQVGSLLLVFNAESYWSHMYAAMATQWRKTSSVGGTFGDYWTIDWLGFSPAGRDNLKLGLCQNLTDEHESVYSLITAMTTCVGSTPVRLVWTASFLLIN